MRYNLLDEEWMPVLYSDGTYARVGIRQAFSDAGTIRQIAASNPMDRLAVLRFLLALLYWCKGNPPETVAGDLGDALPSDWFFKLDANKDCFNLLGEGKRFYQDVGARRSRAITDLVQEIPTGNNFWHFRHSTDSVDGLCLPCCAMGLLRLPLFSVSGLPNLKSGINGTPPVYAVSWGKSLMETLCGSWTPRDSLGIPAWMDPGIRPNPDEEVPLLTGLTLLSRRVWLHAPVERSGQCVGCGAKTSLVMTCEYESAGEQNNSLWDDPHVVYVEEETRKSLKAPDLTNAGKFRMDRPWHALFARLAETNRLHSGNMGQHVLLVGFSTSKAKNIDVWERTIAFECTESRPKTASLIGQWQDEGFRLTRRLRPRTEKKTGRNHVEIPSALAVVRPHVEHRVSAKAGELLSESETSWDEAAREYRPMMEVIAKSLSPGFTVSAIQRRREIANTLPNMNPKAERTKKPRPPKKGSGK